MDKRQINFAMREYYIGIDPGSKGFACIYEASGNRYFHFPIFDSKRLNPDLLEFLKGLSGNDIMAVIEQVHSMPHQGIASTFTFGTNYGKVFGVLETLGIPYSTVTPAKWQRVIWESCDKADTTKQTSFNAARRLFPPMDFRKSERSKTFDDNKVDATLICEYAKRKQL